MVRFIQIMPLLMKHNPMESVIVIDNRFTYFSYQTYYVSYIAMVSFDQRCWCLYNILY